MRSGKQVEYGSANRIFEAPHHPYTQYLIRTRKILIRSFTRAMAQDPESEGRMEEVAC